MIYTLGPFRLDTHDAVLFRGTEPVALGRRAVALLCALVERPGALVSKDVLIEAAWPGQAVEDSNLTVQIAALRRVLGEATPGGDRWIETMPRHGYRFIGPVVAKETPSPPVVKSKRNKAQLEKKRTLGMKENLPLGPGVPENSIRLDSRDEGESEHHPTRCLPSSICLRRLSPSRVR